jgi:outer membrane protein assembly factor BamD (BamD/ComL family)
MNRLHGLLLFTAVTVSLVLLGACRTSPSAIEENLTPAGYFQRAQDAADQGEYSSAIQYYTLFQQRHPEDRERGAWADYEIAFLYHRMGRDGEALTLLATLLDRYEKEGNSLPPAPRILAVRLKARIEEIGSKKP